jgi:acyl-ACP thioesterase
MKCKMDKEITVLPSLCDNTAKLSVPSIVSLFMDLASEHAPKIGLGADVLAEKDMFWITVRTKISIIERPTMPDTVLASTWPEAPGRIRCNRYYKLSSDNKDLALGKTEWAIIDKNSGRPVRISDIYPEGIEHIEDNLSLEAFSKISEDISTCEKIYSYHIRSTDIDLAQHMNNAAYIRALFGALSSEELEEMNIKGLEVNFRTPCYEGERLDIYKRDKEFLMVKEGGKVAASVKIEY